MGRLTAFPRLFHPAIPRVCRTGCMQRRALLPLFGHLLGQLAAAFAGHGDVFGLVFVVRVHAVGQGDVVFAEAVGEGAGLGG